MATDPLAIETAARKAADDALDTRLKAVEAKVGITPPVVEPPITQPPVVTPPATTGVYGSGLIGDSRANLQVGWTNRAKISYRFRSLGGQAISLRVQERGGPVYSGGNGGTVKATIQADANGNPSGTPLASLSWSPGNPSGKLGGLDAAHVRRRRPCSPPTACTTSSSRTRPPIPSPNYISLNGLFHFGSTPTPRTAAFSDDFAFMYNDKGSWVVQTAYVPIFDLAYADGRHDGSAYIGTLADRFGLINGTANMVREKFTVSGGNRTVSKAHVRLKRISGTGNLVVRLESGTGTVLGQATVPSSSIAVGAAPPGNLQGDTWAHVTFPAPIVLTNGQTYALRLVDGRRHDLHRRPDPAGHEQGPPVARLRRRRRPAHHRRRCQLGRPVRLRQDRPPVLARLMESDLPAIRERHGEVMDWRVGNWRCTFDNQPWPCDAVQLLARVAELEAALRRLRDFVNASDPAILDAFAFTEVNRVLDARPDLDRHQEIA